MDANQLMQALARAVELAKPAPEYCFLAEHDYWWTVCMTKAEWSGWMQAIGAVVAILYSGRLLRLQLADARAHEVSLYARRMSPYVAIFEEATLFVQDAVSHSDTTSRAVGFIEYRYNAESLQKVTSALADIQAESLESTDGARALLKLQNALDAAAHLVIVVSNYGDGDWASVDEDEFREYLSKLHDDAQFAMDTIKRLATPPSAKRWYQFWNA